MKRSMLILLAVLMLLLAPAAQLRANAAETGTCGENLTWTLDDAGTLTISGTGAMDDYASITQMPWYSQRESIQSVVLEDGVTTIGDYAFESCRNLSSVTIPDSVTTIGEWAFCECESLTSVTIPEGVTSIGILAFGYCTNLSSIIIPESVTTIRNLAFYNCTALSLVHYGGTEAQRADLTISSNNSNLENAQWHYGCDGTNCPGLPPVEKSGTCGENLTWTLDDAGTLTISGTGAMYDYISETEVPWYSHRKAIQSVVMEDGVTTIGDYAFNNCTRLTSVTIADSVTTIGNYAFYNCTALSVVHYGGTEAQKAELTLGPDNSDLENAQWHYGCDGTNCPGLPPVEKSETCGENLTWTLDDAGTLTISGIGAMYDYTSETEVPWHSQRESIQSVVLEDGVTTIGNYAFYNCTALSVVHYGGTEAQRAELTIGPNNSDLENAQWHYECDGTNCPELPSVVGTGTCGENLTWTLDDAGTLTISGTGPMTDYSYLSSLRAPWYSLREAILSIVLEDGVTGIGDSAFRDCMNLSNVAIPDSVSSIGDHAFYQCESLCSITIPEGVTSIGERAFYGCESLCSITIPEGVTSIGGQTFYYCESLRSITIPVSVTSIGDLAFFECSGLSMVHYPGTEEQKAKISIGSNNSELEDAQWHYECTGTNCPELPPVEKTGTCGANLAWTLDDEGILTISGTGAMDNYTYEAHAPWYSLRKAILSVVVEDGVTGIGNSAFYNCANLSSITISDSVTCIGDEAFSGCQNLSSVTLPDRVTGIGDYAFDRCTSLSSITIPDSVTAIGIGAFIACENLGSITIPNSVISIGDYAFADCDSLSSVTIGDSVTSIGIETFRFCTSLRSITIGDSVTSIGENAFWCCSNLHSISIPNSVTTIGPSAFSYCSSLTSIIIPDGVTSIGDYTFIECTSLRNILIPDSVTSIGDNAFNCCSRLMAVHYTGTEAEKATISIGSNNFDLEAAQWHFECPGMTCPGLLPAAKTGTCGDDLTWTLDDEGILTISGTGTMYDYSVGSPAPWYPLLEDILSIVLEDGITNIGDAAFRECTNLSSITIPNSVISIGQQAFYECTSLTGITLTDSIASIGDFAFAECVNLSSITIPDGITTINESAFFCCSNLSSVTIPNSVTSIGDSAFSYCTSLDSITLPDSVTNIGEWAFSDCTGLTSITIPEGVTGISERAFFCCESLNSITIPDSVTSIGEGTFFGCTSLTGITLPDSVTSIGKWAFHSCENLRSITIPKGITSIGEKTFFECASLSSITIPAGVTTIGDWSFAYCESLSSITIPEGVTAIGDGAFSYCTGLSSITIPDSVTIIGDSAFYYCPRLIEVHYTGTEAQKAAISIGSGNQDFEYIQWHCNCTGTNCPDPLPILGTGFCGQNVIWTLDKTGALTISGTGAMYDYTYALPAPWYFNRNAILSVVVENGVTSIDEYAFEDCSNLSSITIPEGVTYIGEGAFYDCTSLSNITIPNSVTNINDYVFYGCTSLSSITIGDGVSSIGDYTFSFCTSLSSIAIGNGVTHIGERAFYNCTSLSSITIPEGVTNIDDYTFSSCTSLSNISIPNSVTSIGDYAFFVCTGLTDVYYAGTEEEKAAISIGSGNSDLENAQWHYASAKENPFVDVAEDAYYFDPILWAVEKGIAHGMSANTFAPDATCTRGQVVTFLWRASGCPKSKNTDNPFSDVKSGDYYYDAILWAVENGITSGMSATTFEPDAACTRGQVATFLWRTQGKPTPSGSKTFTDVAPGTYYYDAILWAAENGITHGMGGSIFAPDATCTRGQIVTFLYRAMN